MYFHKNVRQICPLVYSRLELIQIQAQDPDQLRVFPNAAMFICWPKNYKSVSFCVNSMFEICGPLPEFKHWFLHVRPINITSIHFLPLRPFGVAGYFMKIHEVILELWPRLKMDPDPVHRLVDHVLLVSHVFVVMANTYPPPTELAYYR